MAVHIVLPPRPILQSVSWLGECTCGEQIVGLDPDDVRKQCQPHRAAERDRMGRVWDAERDASRRWRREARRSQRRVRSAEQWAADRKDRSR